MKSDLEENNFTGMFGVYLTEKWSSFFKSWRSKYCHFRLALRKDLLLVKILMTLVVIAGTVSFAVYSYVTQQQMIAKENESKAD